MVSEPQSKPPEADDLEDTQELPLLDLEAYEAGLEPADSALTDHVEVTLVQPRPVLTDGAAATDFAAVEAEVVALGADVERLRGLLTAREAALAAASQELAGALQRASDAEAARAAAEARLAAAAAEIEVAREERSALWQRQESLEAELRSSQALVEALNAAVAERAAALAAINTRVANAERAAAWAEADTRALRARLAAAHESLRSRETRRGIWESIWRDADAALAASSLAGGELAQRLQQAEVRIIATERDLAASQSATQAARSAAEEAREAAASAVERARLAEEQLASLRAALAGSEQRGERLAGELQAAREANDRLRTELGAARESLQALEHRLADSESRAEARITELQAHLAEAEGHVHRLEVELSAKAARIEALSTLESARDVGPGAPPAPTAAPTEQFPTASALHAADGATAATGGVRDPPPVRRESELLPDGPPRFLILSEGNAETVFRLGRRTTIGRAEDNDISLGRASISRHHAVIHSGPRQTVIEDLNSTNGVLVNRRRVREAALRDGDVVHIGKCKFRFSQRQRGGEETA